MENKKTKILAVLCVLLSIGFISTAFAYYQAQTNDVKNTFIAAGSGEMFDFDNEDPNLKGVFKIDESKANADSYGVYTLDEEDRVKTNDYIVLPGVNIPKDPMITIKNKSSIPAYLYLEVVDTCSGYFEYTLENCWISLGIKGVNGGDVYLYKVDNNSILNAVPSLEIGIIYNDILNTKTSITETQKKSLEFYAYLAQTGLGTEAETYTKCFTN